jgi:hypothetical protein
MYARHFETFDADEDDRRSRAIGCTTVYRLHVGRYVAACSCGWSARRRIVKAMACQDAWMHAARGGCDVSVPLVIPGRNDTCPH